MKDEEQLRKELQSILESDPKNYSKILDLSSKLSRFDNQNVRFSVDAGVIDRLGKELVIRHETAVAELVKNAFDADADEVELFFKNANIPGGTLTIKDSGTGMTRNQIIDGFMRISSTEKVHSPISERYKRLRAGRKGLGRFATQRLGERLTIISQTEGNNKALKVTIDWNKFLLDTDIFLIANAIEEIPKLREEGTTLIIENLREAWTVTSVKRVYRYLADIILPSPISKSKSNKNVDPGFAVKMLAQEKNGNIVTIADEQSMFYDHAVAVIEGRVDEDGRAFWSVISKKLDVGKKEAQIGRDEKDEKSKFETLKNVNFKAYYYIFNVDLIPKLVEGYIRESIKENGSIKLYRNGFRVLPYGDPNDDWLGLDASIARRTILPVHANNNFLGFVEVKDIDGANFQEPTSREGLAKTKAFDELVDYLYRSIIAGIIKIAEARNVKITTSQKNWIKESPGPTTVSQIADEMSKFADELSTEGENEGDASDGNNSNNSGDKKSRAESIRDISKQLKAAAEELNEIGMLRVLAGLGLVIGEFIHEINQYIPAFGVDSNYLVNHIKKTTEEYKRAIRLKETFGLFSSYTAYFDKTISENINRELIPIEIRDVVKDFISVIKSDTERNGFTVLPDFSGYDLFTCKMHSSEWASILFNLYSNSKKAIIRAASEGNIFIKGWEEKNKIFLDFADNGDGISPENKYKIFRAFFTTTSPKGRNTEHVDEMTGTGLGLKIVNDIISGYGGEIYLTTPPKNYTTCFRIELPKATESEINEYENI